MIRQKFTKTITASYTTTDADCGYRIICASASNITITLHTATGKTNFELEIDNIGAGTVTVGGKTLKTDTHAHVGNNGGTAWSVVVGGGSMTKAEIEAVLTGIITSHNHILIGSTAPTTSTVAGFIGQFYLETSSPPVLHQCTAISESTYTWTDIISVSSYTLTQATASALGGIKAADKTASETVPVKIDPSSGILYVPAAGSASNGLPSGGSVGQALVKKSATNYDAEWKYAARSRLYVPNGSPYGAYDDEFDNGSLDSAWIPVDVTNFANTWTEAENVKGLSCLAPSGKGGMKLCGLLKSFTGLSAPFYIQTAVKLYSRAQSYPGAGLIFSDGVTVGSGIQVTGGYLTDAGMQTANWTGFNSRTSYSEIGIENNGFVGWLHIRFVYESNNTFKLLSSLDGVNWVDMHGAKSYTITPTHFGIFESTFNNSEQPLLTNFGYFRVRSGSSVNG